MATAAAVRPRAPGSARLVDRDRRCAAALAWPLGRGLDGCCSTSAAGGGAVGPEPSGLVADGLTVGPTPRWPAGRLQTILSPPAYRPLNEVLAGVPFRWIRRRRSSMRPAPAPRRAPPGLAGHSRPRRARDARRTAAATGKRQHPRRRRALRRQRRAEHRHPLRRRPAYRQAAARPSGRPEPRCSASTTHVGLHPGCWSLKPYGTGQLAVVQGVGYPNPDRRHFRSMDIWQRRSRSLAVTGWVGRWLDAAARSPLDAIAVGSTLPRVLAGERIAGAVIPTGASGLRLDATTKDAWQAMQTPSSTDALLLARAAQSGTDLLAVSAAVAAVLNQPASTTSSTAAPGNSSALDTGEPSASGTKPPNILAGQLDTVAQMIRAGLPTRAYVTSMGGFDTHANEGPTHPTLLADLDAAVAGFFESLVGHPRGESVVLVVYSEFGRRPTPDASGGTDHGVAAPVFVAGPAVKGGFVGDRPSPHQIRREWRSGVERRLPLDLCHAAGRRARCRSADDPPRRRRPPPAAAAVTDQNVVVVEDDPNIADLVDPTCARPGSACCWRRPASAGSS